MSSSLIATIRRPVDLKSAVLGAWYWWYRHLCAATDTVVPNALRERVLAVDVRADGERVHVNFGDRSSLWLTAGDDTAAHAAQIAEVSRERQADRVLATLRLSSRLFVTKKISLPTAARGNLTEA